jgi:hypothetical protein
MEVKKGGGAARIGEECARQSRRGRGGWLSAPRAHMKEGRRCCGASHNGRLDTSQRGTEGI